MAITKLFTQGTSVRFRFSTVCDFLLAAVLALNRQPAYTVQGCQRVAMVQRSHTLDSRSSQSDSALNTTFGKVSKAPPPLPKTNPRDVRLSRSFRKPAAPLPPGFSSQPDAIGITIQPDTTVVYFV